LHLHAWKGSDARRMEDGSSSAEVDIGATRIDQGATRDLDRFEHPWHGMRSAEQAEWQTGNAWKIRFT